jgi:hypothetical protein
MAIVINGDGSISGISAGGLPTGSVTADTLATNSVDSAELIDGAVDDSHMAAMAASKLTGALPAISGASLTGLSSGDLVFLASSTGSTVANVDITTGFSASDYNLYMIALDGVVSLSSGSTLQMRISNDGGSTWLSSCYSRGSGYDYDDTRFSYQGNNTTHWNISHSGPVSWPGRSGVIWLTNTGATLVSMNCSITGNDNTSAANGPCWFIGSGYRVTTVTADAVRFQMSTGNMHGTFRLYGVKKA